MKSLLLRSIAFGLCISTIQIGTASANDAIKDLPANTWIYLNPKPTRRLIPVEHNESPKMDDVVRGEPVRREYTSPVMGDGKLYYFGGGHSGYPGNDVEVYDIEANTWTQAYAPECPPKDDSTYYSGGSERISPTRKPYVLHGYSRTTWDAQNKRFLCCATNSLAAFDPKTNAWTWIAGKHAPESKPQMPLNDAQQLSLWDDALGGILMFGHYQMNGIWLFKDGTFTELKNPGVSFAKAGGAALAYLPDLQSHLIGVLPAGDKDPAHLYLYNAVAGSVKEIKSIPPALAVKLAPPLANFTYSYDTKHRKVIALTSEEGKVIAYSYDPRTDQWAALPARESAPRMKTFEAGHGRGPGVFQYDPIHDIFILLAEGKDPMDVQTWAYRFE